MGAPVFVRGASSFAAAIKQILTQYEHNSIWITSQNQCLKSWCQQRHWQ